MNPRVVLFGGTFDPPHIGHLLMAQLAHEETQAEVWWLPAPVPPHKLDAPPATPYDVRVEMVRALVAGHSGMQVSTIEAELPKPSYTVDTVAALRQRHPGTSFLFLIGSDSLAALDTWHEAARLTEAVSFLVAVRSGYPFAATYERMRSKLPRLVAQPLEMPLIDVSSSWIRERAARGLPLCGVVPEAVVRIWRRACGASTSFARACSGCGSGGDAVKGEGSVARGTEAG